MKWLKRFCAVNAYLRRVREFNRTTKGTRIAANRKSAGATYDRRGQEALDHLVTLMIDMGRREEELFSDSSPHESDKR